MRRCVSVILFTCIFIFTSSYSHWTAVDSQYCPVMNTSGIRCVNRTLNSTLCTKEETMEGQLARYTKVQPQYVLLSYNWDSFVLSEPLKSVEEQPLCSLWAKEPYKKAVPMSTYNYFLRLCKDPKNASYPASCE
uniref:Lipocalin n=1 Tax=Rhipicephalus zambeziensis TaxID=60191 RepID=A0A224YI81_9ACAR